MRRRLLIIALALDLLVLIGGEVRVFVHPPSQRGGHPDAVIALGGLDDDSRIRTAEHLVKINPGSLLVLSRGTGPVCPYYITFRPVVCFRPDPESTRGEAEEIAVLARKYGWTSITVVTTAEQSSRARLRVSRCFHGKLRMVVAPMPLSKIIGRLPYENAATVKAELWQRGC